MDPHASCHFALPQKQPARKPTQQMLNALLLGANLVLNTSPEAGMEIGFNYKGVIRIMQNILLLMFSCCRKTNKQKRYLKMLIENSQIPKNTFEKDLKIPF